MERGLRATEAATQSSDGREEAVMLEMPYTHFSFILPKLNVG